LRSAKDYDHPFILKKEKELEISLFHEKTGRKLEVYTDQKAVIVYTGNYLGDNEGKLSCGVIVRPRLGVCLETQDLPNYINVGEFESTVYTSSNPYRAMARYVFTNS